MVSLKSVEAQLKRIKFNHHAWGRAEAEELPNILLPDEKIFECVNGIYEGGFALLVATNLRLLLVDKKPFKFLNVEDMRFDMITEIDYNHRLIGARIKVNCSGSKDLQFRSYNQKRLRQLISHVQHRMAEAKKEQSQSADTQKQHLEQINQQLQAYLLAQHQQQETLRKQLEEVKAKTGTELPTLEPIRPDPQLSDYLFAQNLLRKYEDEQPDKRSDTEAVPLADGRPAPIVADNPLDAWGMQSSPQLADLYAEGMQEIFGRKHEDNREARQATAATPPTTSVSSTNPLEINPLKVAYSKLPMVLRDRKFGRSSFRSTNQQPTTSTP